MWVGLVVNLLAAAASLRSAHAEDWPRWRGPRGDGSWHGPRLPQGWPGTGLKPLWERPLGPGYAGVTVAEGRVVTLDRQREPTERERVVCFDAATGQPLWIHEYAVEYGDLPYGSGPRASATLHAGRVYTLGALGHVVCLDLATGRPVWTRDTVGELGARRPEWGFAASPLVWREQVIVHVGATPGGCYVALAAADGRELWRAGNDPAGYATPQIVARPAGEQLVGWTPEHIVGIDPARARVDWRIPYPVTYGVSIADPILSDETVFVAGYWEGSKAIRLGSRRDEATLVWEDKQSLRGLMSQPLVRDGLVYLLDKQYGLTCFELATGKKLWDDGNRLTPRGRNPQASLVWLGDEDQALALNAEGELVLLRLRRDGYQELGRTRIVGPTWAHPAYAGDRVYARDDERLVCVPLVE